MIRDFAMRIMHLAIVRHGNMMRPQGGWKHGGDYGFARTPQGENARDIAHFVRYLGYSPAEALVCATRYGAELMGMGHEAGQVREGFLADLLLVDGDPVADVNILPNNRQHRTAGEPDATDLRRPAHNQQ